ncbi:MAG: reverse transcriptase family protein [Verrucomicrobiales bacterium]
METWSAHQLFQASSEKLGDDTAAAVQRYAGNLRSNGLPVIFTLGHLGKITGIDYDLLHASVNRRRESSNYTMFSVRKRSGGRRFIHAVNGKLHDLHQYLNEEILQKIEPHPSSFAFHPSGGIRQCAAMHCGCKWLLQFDLKDFFYSVAEPAVYRVFCGLGYKSLLAFELARLCTTVRLPDSKSHHVRLTDAFPFDGIDEPTMPYHPRACIGVLPQGAPTSPMLSNLVARKLDRMLFNFALENGFVYTRYADDLAFSASRLPSGKSVTQLRREIISHIRKGGFRENKKKIRIAGPGAKRTVLGLLVDGQKPKLTKELRKRIDRNLYSIEEHDLRPAADHYGFDSPFGFFNHVSGLMSFIHDADPDEWHKLNPRFEAIKQKLSDTDFS